MPRGRGKKRPMFVGDHHNPDKNRVMAHEKNLKVRRNLEPRPEELEDSHVSASFLRFQQSMQASKNKKYTPDYIQKKKKEKKIKFKTKMRPGEGFRSYSRRIVKEQKEMLDQQEKEMNPTKITVKRKEFLTARKKEKALKKKKQSGDAAVQDSKDKEEEEKFGVEDIEFNDIAERPPMQLPKPKTKAHSGVTLSGLVAGDEEEEDEEEDDGDSSYDEADRWRDHAGQSDDEDASEAEEGQRPGRKKTKKKVDKLVEKQKKTLELQRAQARRAYQLMKQRRRR